MQFENRRLEVKIPPGVDTGSRVRIAGEGLPGMGGGPDRRSLPGYLGAAAPLFKREGNDIRYEATVDLYTALLGGEVRVPTLTGNVMLRIPPETQNGQTLRLRGQGLPLLKSPDTRGDLYVAIKVVLPQTLSDRERSSCASWRRCEPSGASPTNRVQR